MKITHTVKCIACMAVAAIGFSVFGACAFLLIIGAPMLGPCILGVIAVAIGVAAAVCWQMQIEAPLLESIHRLKRATYPEQVQVRPALPGDIDSVSARLQAKVTEIGHAAAAAIRMAAELNMEVAGVAVHLEGTEKERDRLAAEAEKGRRALSVLQERAPDAPPTMEEQMATMLPIPSTPKPARDVPASHLAYPTPPRLNGSEGHPDAEGDRA